MKKSEKPQRRQSTRIREKREKGELPESFNTGLLFKKHEKKQRVEKMKDEKVKMEKRIENRKKWKESQKQKEKEYRERMREIKKERGVTSRKRKRSTKKSSSRGSGDGPSKRKYRKTSEKQSLSTRRKKLKTTTVWFPTEDEISIIKDFNADEEEEEAPQKKDVTNNMEDEVEGVNEEEEEEEEEGEMVDLIQNSLAIFSAFEEDNFEEIKRIFKDHKHVHNPLIPRSAHNPETILDLAIQADRLDIVKWIDTFLRNEKKKYYKENTNNNNGGGWGWGGFGGRNRNQNDGKNPRTSVVCGLQKAQSGSVSHRTFGHAVRKINSARGGKEGNDAFLKDSGLYERLNLLNFEYQYQEIIKRCIEKRKFSTQMINFFALMSQQLRWFLGTDCFYYLVLSGQWKEAGYIVKSYTEGGHEGYGFNKIHLESLTLSSDSDEFTKPMRSTSITKKSSMESFQVTPVHCAAVNPNPKFLKELILGSSVHVVDKRKRKPIHFAAACSKEDNIAFLLKNGADLGEKDIEGMTPLHIACKYGRKRVIKYLLEHHQEQLKNVINGKNRSKWTPLHFAVQSGSKSTVETLVEYGVCEEVGLKIDTIGGMDSETALMTAAKLGHLKIVKYLLSEKEDGNKKKISSLRKQDKRKRNTLMYAVINDQFEVCRYLLRKGSSPFHKDGSENGVLHYAASYCHDVKLMRLLRKLKLEELFGAYNMWKTLPLVVSILKNNPFASFYILRKVPFDVNAKNEEGKTILHQLLENKDASNFLFVRFFLKKKNVDLEVQDNDGNSLFHLIARMNLTEQERKDKEKMKEVNDINLNIANRILEKIHSRKKEGRMDEILNSKNAKEKTPLMMAIENKNYEIIKWLLHQKIDVQIVNEKENENFLHVLFKGVDVESIAHMKEIFLILKKNYDPQIIRNLCLCNNRDGHFPIGTMIQQYKWKKQEVNNRRRNHCY